MGRLNLRIIRSKSFIYSSIVISIILIAGALLVRQQQNTTRLLTQIETNNLQVGVDEVDGIGQIFYRIGGKETFITNDDKNHINPRVSGKYITWMDESNGSFQVILYDVLEKTRLQLSAFSNNTSPSIDNGVVAWQGMSQDRPSIFVYDGSEVVKISGEYAALRPFVQGNNVLYVEEVSNTVDDWQVVEYTISSKRGRVVSRGPADLVAWPRYENGKIVTTLEGSGTYY